jgi:hypothetical protein
MIRYALRCEADHRFEGWFRSSTDFDRQSGQHLVECPDCGSTAVEKALMAPSIATGGATEPAPAVAEASPPAPSRSPMVAPDAPMREMLTLMRELRRKVLDHGENTGRRFPEEARKIHAGEAEARGIYGEATPEEARALIEEGIEIAPLPILPEDFN